MNIFNLLLSEFLAWKFSKSILNNKVTVLSDAGIGDLVIALDAISNLQAKSISLVTNEKCHELVCGSALFDRIVSINDENTKTILKEFESSDLVVSIRSNYPLMKLLLKSNFNGKYIPNARYERLRFFSRLLSLFSKKYKANYYSRLHMSAVVKKMLGVEFRRYDWVNKLKKRRPSLDLMRMIECIGKFNLINVSGSSGIRKLKYETIKNVVSNGQGWVIVGQGDGWDDLDKEISQNVLNLVNKLSISELLYLIDLANVVVAPDSAIMHLASRYRKKLVAIMGNELVDVFGPIPTAKRNVVLTRNPSCSPCSASTCNKYNGHSCVQDIGSSEILRAINLYESASQKLNP